MCDFFSLNEPVCEVKLSCSHRHINFQYIVVYNRNESRIICCVNSLLLDSVYNKRQRRKMFFVFIIISCLIWQHIQYSLNGPYTFRLAAMPSSATILKWVRVMAKMIKGAIRGFHIICTYDIYIILGGTEPHRAAAVPRRWHHSYCNG